MRELTHRKAAEACGLRLEHYGTSMRCRLYKGDHLVFDGHMCDSWECMRTHHGLAAKEADVELPITLAQVCRAIGDKSCPDCRGTGVRDSGGFYSWGEPIRLPCDCTGVISS